MADSTVNVMRAYKRTDGGMGRVELPLAASASILKGVGAILGYDGYVYAAGGTTAKMVVVSLDEAYTGGTSDGDEVGVFYYSGRFTFTIAAAAAGDEGKIVYLADNNNLTLTDTGGLPIAGVIAKVNSATSVDILLNAKPSGEEGVMVFTAPLVAGTTTTGGDVLNWANPTGDTLVIKSLELDITTPATGAATADAGIAASGTSDDTLMDGVDIGTAAGFFTCFNSAGTNGAGDRLMTSAQFITVTPSATAAGLVGTANIIAKLR